MVYFQWKIGSSVLLLLKYMEFEQKKTYGVQINHLHLQVASHVTVFYRRQETGSSRAGNDRNPTRSSLVVCLDIRIAAHLNRKYPNLSVLVNYCSPTSDR